MARSARELLKSIHANKGEIPAELLAEIGGFLGEAVHVGDTITIKPTPDGPWWKEGHYDENRKMVYNEDIPAGLEFTTHNDSYVDDEGETHEFSYREYKFPEAGPVGYLKGTDFDGAFVVDINGRRFRVDLHLNQEGDMGVARGVVTFTRTEDDLTTFETWDHAEAVAIRRAQLVTRLAANKAELKTADAEWAQYTRDDIKRNEEDIAECDAGELKLNHPFYIQVFGQPNFIQNEVFPTHEGRSGMCLASIETEWGDSGNINVLFACDEDGLPCRIWTEASCC